MKQICTFLITLLLAYGSILAQEGTVIIDSDVYAAALEGTAETNNGLLTSGTPEVITSDQPGSHILIANPPPANNGGADGWAIFQDLIAGPRWITITGMTTASTAAAGAGYNIEFFTRSGTALGGPGGDPTGWTSLVTVAVTQGAAGNTGVSELFATPVININPGDTVGLAMLFTGVGPRYFGTGAPPFQVFADTNLTLITGEGRSVPFGSGSVFASRGLVGEIHYDEFIPVELASFTALAAGNTVELSWVTATELNNLGFEVERKTESANWTDVGFVNGYGTTTENQIYSFVDRNLSPGAYSYRLKQIDFDGSFKYYELAETIEIGSLKSYSLSQNYPNPFNPSTIISWQAPVAGYNILKVYDELGSEVATLINEELPSGNYEVEFDATGLTSGIYFYRLQSGEFTETKQMILLK